MKSSKIRQWWCQMFYGHEWIITWSSGGYRLWSCGRCEARPTPFRAPPDSSPGERPGP